MVGGGCSWGRGTASNGGGAPRPAFIIMIILDIPCPKQSQRTSQPAKLSLLPFSFPILILFLPGRSGRHISRSGHKIHSPLSLPSSTFSLAFHASYPPPVSSHLLACLLARLVQPPSPYNPPDLLLPYSGGELKSDEDGMKLISCSPKQRIRRDQAIGKKYSSRSDHLRPRKLLLLLINGAWLCGHFLCAVYDVARIYRNEYSFISIEFLFSG